MAIGTLTRIPVPAPKRIDKTTAGGAMAMAPIVGAVIGLVIGTLAWLASEHLASTASTLLISVLAICAIAYITRGIHLDGLADTVDALGSGKPADQALAIARRSDIGPFGVVALVAVILVDVTAYAGAVDAGHAILVLVIAAGTARMSLVLACSRGVPAARSEGLGATVASSVPVPAAIGAVAAWLAACVAITAVVDRDLIITILVSVVGALAVAGIGLRVCVRRLGGITGDVLGALVELTFAAALVLLVAIPS